MYSRIQPWNLVFSALFAALVLWGTAWLTDNGLLSPVSAGDFLLLSLAIMRLTRLVVYDHIFEFARSWFSDAKKYSFRGTIGQLVNCAWCTGLWFAFFVPFFYFATPYAWFIVLVLALAAVGSFIQVLANLIGWHAEAKKLEVQDRAQ